MLRPFRLALVLGFLVLWAPPASASFIKGGFSFAANDATVDTSSSHWLAGIGSDRWLSDMLAIGFEVDFTYTRTRFDDTDEVLSTYYIYPYVTAKLRLPTRGFQLYTGGGLGYSPIITQFDGRAQQVGGMGMQVLAGVGFGNGRGRGSSLFVEAQYKRTEINSEDAGGRLFAPGTGSYDLFTVMGGINF
jgi:hypothetical protein